MIHLSLKSRSGSLVDGANSILLQTGPSEVEAVLQEHPAVVESAVVASPSPERGEVVKAFIVLSNTVKHEDPENLIKSIQEHCKKVAAPYKYPRRVEFVSKDFLPRTPSGKIKRSTLRKYEKDRCASTAKL